MRKIFAFSTIFVFLMAVSLYAQQAPAPAPKPAPPEKSYMAVGAHLPFTYYIEAENGSMKYYGITFKAPIKNAFGAQFSVNKMLIPIEEFKLNQITRSGYGQEEYTNFQLGVLYFMPFHKYFQAKLGLDYFKFDNGYIADEPAMDPADPNCGVMYTHCSNCAHDLYGLFIGANLDVPLHERILIMSGLSYHWILNEHPSTKKGFANFNLGLGYKI